MTIIKTLQQLGIQDREIYLFDTFDGMSQPTEYDTRLDGTPAIKNIEKNKKIYICIILTKNCLKK